MDVIEVTNVPTIGGLQNLQLFVPRTDPTIANKEKQFKIPKHVDPTANEAFAKKRIPLALQNHIIVQSLPFEEIPKYLSVGDIAFAIREPKLSMQGVAPIKLGEYLLIGIPTIASSGIGDTESLLKDKNFCFLYKHDAKDSVENAIKFIEKSGEFDKVDIQNFGIDNFSMKISTSSYKIALDYCS
jgi:hypothetical protein